MDKLLYLVLPDRGQPETHSPAWDWQYVIRNPKAKQRYGYRARVVVKPFNGEEQVWEEYRRWVDETEASLPRRPE